MDKFKFKGGKRLRLNKEKIKGKDDEKQID